MVSMKYITLLKENLEWSSIYLKEKKINLYLNF